MAHNSYFRYGSGEVNDMVFKSLNRDEPIPFNVVLLNKKNYVVVIVAVPGRDSEGLKQSFILDMLNK